mmetsp:Transcript_28457/g.42584  ORF Transcript_28457/g.42584 Transcript_28457/m.42584 type:complete len:453 (+) Transcript_28457:75-1433(+)
MGHRKSSGLMLTMANICMGLTTSEMSRAPVLATQANTDFGLALFQKLKGADNGGENNVIFSPYSISNALAMVVGGAQEQTLLEIGNVLSLPADQKKEISVDPVHPWRTDIYLAGMGIQNERFNRKDKPYALNIANAIWGEKSYGFSTNYISALETSFGKGTFQTANFQHHPEKERLRINSWVEDSTENKIKDLIEEGVIDGSTEMVVVNAIHFKANWLNQFDKTNTKTGDFFLDDDKSVEVELMNANSMTGIKYGAFNTDGSFFKTPEMINLFDTSDSANYPAEDGFSMIELPYEGNELSMVVLVPRKKSGGLSSIEELLVQENLSSWIEKLEDRKVHVTLPKFKAEAGYALNDYLKEMGMESAFSASANFNGMAEESIKSDMQISQVIHKAFIEVDEEGTEAAAATAVVMSRSAMQPFIPNFSADKSFIYLIRDIQSGAILFLGRMANPSL